MKPVPKSVLVPVDGSGNSLRTLDYLKMMFGSDHHLKLHLAYVMPALPLIFGDDNNLSREDRGRLRAMEKRNKQMAERILHEARDKAIDLAFDSAQIKTHCLPRLRSVVQDITELAIAKRCDAVVLTRRGRTDARSFFMGEVSSKLVEVCTRHAIWVIGGTVSSTNVIMAVDPSENALRAVDHAGFMLSGTAGEVTLFHSKRHLRRFVPLEILEAAPGINELWLQKAQQSIDPYLDKARSILLRNGLSPSQIQIKVVDGSRSPADDILDEARSGGYGTLVMGRRGLSMMREFFMGSVSSKVLQAGAGMAVVIVQ
jgi:nucleotide-binding universal stress UspA family protein